MEHNSIYNSAAIFTTLVESQMPEWHHMHKKKKKKSNQNNFKDL